MNLCKPYMRHDEPRPKRDGGGEQEGDTQRLYVELHRKYIVALQEKRNTFGACPPHCSTLSTACPCTGADKSDEREAGAQNTQ